jgi:SH3-like domain-containing protein
VFAHPFMPGFRPRSLRIIAASILLYALSGCNAKTERAPVIGHAYAGPAALNLHKEIDSKSPTVTIVHHGDALEIVGQRRRWYRVRTKNGTEGWTSDRDLLDTAQMQRLSALAAETTGMPSQGAATTFSNLNVHTEPSRQSPSFVQVKEHEKVDVIAHKVAERAATAQRRELIPPQPKPAKKKGKEKASKIPEPPVPPAPEPPADWLELSRQGEPKPDAAPVPVSQAARGPVDDWTLIRTATGQSGWVLTGGLYLTIPDEVAQYAEGHRITSYFSIGKVADKDVRKDIWLWTTSAGLGEDYDFDGYRVFTWSLRHHRYETAYIQRRERGFFPVLAKAGEFSVCLENDDGSRVRKHYVMKDTSVRPVGVSPCEKPEKQTAATQSLVKGNAAAEPAPKKSFTDRFKDKTKGLFGK